MTNINLIAVPGIPDVKMGDDVAKLVAAGVKTAVSILQPGDIIAIAQKIVSKAEGRTVRLADVTPGVQALDVAQQTDKDPRLVELILRESEEISRLRQGVLIVRHRLGFTSANAG
ncbi:MAG: coenzyme F420-0:L-glutamate ligase, partial [Anaerolineales bacterium]|nr:coenzyme F420-0:L-glutamate ligase [Anaerolineales bacterium]